MAVHNLIIVNNPAHWIFDIDDVEIVSARDYLTATRFATLKNARVFNLCRSYRYQSVGYYVSLLAAARDHHAIPSVLTMRDFQSQAIIRAIAEETDERVQKALARVRDKAFTLYIYFGQTVQIEYRYVGRALYHLFQAPLLKVTFAMSDKWLIQQISPISLGQVPEHDQEHLAGFARHYFSRKRFPRSRIQQYAYDLAILVNPDEKSPPSCRAALRKFEAAAAKLNVYAEFITKEDYSRLTEFDALFIRETTAVNHHTYRFSRKAYAEGLAVLDDPWSILRCANKVYLAERLAQARLPAPRTVILGRDALRASPRELGITFPCVLKIPDGAFSKGVVKADHPDDFRDKLERLFDTSDLLIAQEFMESEFDWRVGILDRKPLFVCKYYMAPGHWQICNWGQPVSTRFGRSETFPVEEAPRAVVKTALRAAALMGSGLYGVDLKETGGNLYVIEVNDNPSMDSGVEDLVLKDDLYREVIQSLINRIDDPRGAGAER